MYHYAPNLHKDYRSGVETAEKVSFVRLALLLNYQNMAP